MKKVLKNVNGFRKILVGIISVSVVISERLFALLENGSSTELLITISTGIL